MNNKQRISLFLIVILVSFAIGIQTGFSWEGSTSIWSPGYFEEQYINATTEFYRQGDNYTAWIDDTYLLATGSETFSTAAINATTEFYRQGDNYTAWIEEQIWIEGATAFVGFDEHLDHLPNYWYCDGTTDDVQIQAALDYVSGTAPKEKVILTGDFVIDVPINPDSYTIIELYGSITLSNGADCNILYATGKTEIEVLGGEWDGNRANQAADIDGLVFVSSSHITVKYTTVHDILQLVTNGHGIELTSCNDSYILYNTVYNCGDILIMSGGSGISIAQTSNTVVSFNNIKDCDGGVYLWSGVNASTNYNIISFNNVTDVSRDGISLYPSDVTSQCNYNVVIGNVIVNPSLDDDHTGIKVGDEGECIGNVIDGNTIIEDNGLGLMSAGITIFNAVESSSITDNVITNAYIHGILITCPNTVSQFNTINSNTIRNVTVGYGGGIGVSYACNNTFNDNQIYDIGNVAIFIKFGASYNNFADNHIDDALYAIYINNSTCIENCFLGTRVDNIGSTAVVYDLGTDTIYPNICFQFIQGTTFISAAANLWGWEIDADTEWAIALGTVPDALQYIVRIEVWACTLVDPGVGNYMQAQFSGEAAASHEPYNAGEPWDVTDFPCEEDDPSVNDVIHWVIQYTDGATHIAHIRGGESIQFKVLHEGASGGDIETDATFRCIVIVFI